MYYTEMDPFTGAPLFVEKDLTRKMRQKAIVTGRPKKAFTKPGKPSRR